MPEGPTCRTLRRVSAYDSDEAFLKGISPTLGQTVSQVETLICQSTHSNESLGPLNKINATVFPSYRLSTLLELDASALTFAGARAGAQG
jgi:hypothetical protein